MVPSSRFDLFSQLLCSVPIELGQSSDSLTNIHAGFVCEKCVAEKNLSIIKTVRHWRLFPLPYSKLVPGSNWPVAAKVDLKELLALDLAPLLIGQSGDDLAGPRVDHITS